MNDITQVVAIDGPAGAGKSSVARRVADALGYAYLDTGAMYRAATWWAVHRGVDLDDGDALAAVTREIPLELREEGGKLQVLVGGRDVSEEIRSPDVTRRIYKLDQNPQVREHLVALQQEFGRNGPTVAEGRDIGTVVFPKAACKVYLDASLDERTRRRAAQLAEKGIDVDLGALRTEIHERDEKSKKRTVSPLRKADDAVLVDSTTMTPDEVVAAILQLAHERIPGTTCAHAEREADE